MPKTVDVKKLKSLMGSLEKEYGEGSVYTLGSSKANAKIERWSTGIEQFDEIIGGGMPCGRIVEIFGPESAGKTSLCYHLLARHRYAVHAPIEGTFDSERSAIFGNKKGQLILRMPKNGEETLETLNEFAKINMPIVSIDSVPAMKSKKEMNNEDMEKEGQRSQTAKMLSDRLPKIVHQCELSGTTAIFINQLRDKMNASLFGEKDDTPGGRALKFYSSLRIRVARKAWIEIPNKNPKIDSDKQAVGLIMIVKVIKSKVSNPRGICEIPMFFDRGFVSHDDIKPIRDELMKKEREKYK